MPVAKEKPTVNVRANPYNADRRAHLLLPSPRIRTSQEMEYSGTNRYDAALRAGELLQTHASSRPLPLATHWQSESGLLERPNDFISHLSSYLKTKNIAYKNELGSIETALAKSEETSKCLRDTVTSLGKTIDALEGAVTAATHILSSSLICTICLETCSNPTSLRCGHSFCRYCLQSYFLSRFEMKCEHLQIDLQAHQRVYIYRSSSGAVEAERNMVKFSRLSNRINPDYSCPTCREPSLPSVRNSFLDFKLAASLNTLNTLIGYVPPSPPEWKLAGVDFLAFLNSRFFRRYSEAERLGASLETFDDNVDTEMIDSEQ